ncbi:MAG: pyridoxine 5'-phosphate synthase [Betaproteobacteria bacterium SG8_40]|nr:MAG: pyridoxine 5'-phosphate synthase [Betaproteobacteria bacterium SG8_40]
MTRLSVNVNKIALLRNSRTIGIPDVVRLAGIALDAGAHGITVHPRPDERHIRRRDVHELAEMLAGRPAVEFNIEGNPFHQVMDIVRAVQPHQCTLVPDEPGAFTSDHGWNLQRDGERLVPVIGELHALGIRVSLFMGPEPAAMEMARTVGADRVELYTEPYAQAFGTSAQFGSLGAYAAAASAALEQGLGVNAGHDLNRDNLPAFLRAVPDVAEVSIGHALTADALELGMANAVAAYLEAIEQGAAGE